MGTAASDSATRSRKDAVLDGLRLYLQYARISIKGQMQYRGSFVMLVLGHVNATVLEFLGIWALFDRFSRLRGWTLAEVALLYGIVHVAFAIAEGVGRGFDVFAGMVKGGDFDRVLLRPRSTALQIAGSHVQLMRIGRLLQGLAVLLWAVFALEIAWTPARIALTLAAIGGGTCTFIGLFVLQATLAFWTIESLEIVNTVTYGGVETAQFPLSIYKRWFRRFFTFIVPLACINYFPTLSILDRAGPMGFPQWVSYLSPALGAAFLLVCLQVWKFGVRHYRSTGS